MAEEKKARNLKLLEMRETMSAPQIAQELGIGRQRVYQLLRRLELRGRNGIAIDNYIAMRKQELKAMKEAWVGRLGKDQRYMELEEWRKLERNLQAESAKARAE